MIETDQVVWLSNKFPEWSSLQSRNSYQQAFHSLNRNSDFVEGTPSLQ